MTKKDRILMLVESLLEERGPDGLMLNEIEREVWRQEKELFNHNRIYCKSYVIACICELNVAIQNKKVILLDEFQKRIQREQEEEKRQEERRILESGANVD